MTVGRAAASLLLAAAGSAVEWSMPIPSGGKVPTVEVCPFKYGKQWAYAVEIDDGPKWARTFAVPFLADYQFTDAPPGVAGGKARPFVGGIAIIVGVVGANGAAADWKDLAAMREAGWGVLNHSLTHEGRGWEPAGRLSDQQVREDAWWSQALIAAGLSGSQPAGVGGRAATSAVYANGYVDYNRGGALEAVGLRAATRVGGQLPADVTRGEIPWMDLGRNYLDDGAWVAAGGGAMLGIPDAPANQLVIDFTHGIDQSADSPNQQRWRERLSTIAARWGAKGSDSLWCAPTDEIVDYLRGARAAKAAIAKGALAVSLSDDVPGTALTLKLTGLDARAKLEPPADVVVYRQGDTAWITTPLIGLAGAKPPARLVAAYDGPPGDIDLHGARAIAGVQCSIFGDLPAGFAYKITLRTASGERPVVEQTLPPGWFVGAKVHPIAPTAEPIIATAAHIDATKGITRVVVWAIDGDSATDPAAKSKPKSKR